MVFKDKEVILKLNEENFARLTACLVASLMIAKDDEVRDNLIHLIYTVVTQISD